MAGEVRELQSFLETKDEVWRDDRQSLAESRARWMNGVRAVHDQLGARWRCEPDGRVILRGRLPSLRQKRIAEEDAWNVAAVRGVGQVRNRIAAEPHPPPSTIA